MATKVLSYKELILQDDETIAKENVDLTVDAAKQAVRQTTLGLEGAITVCETKVRAALRTKPYSPTAVINASMDKKEAEDKLALHLKVSAERGLV